ncbi:FAD-binding protein [Litoribacter ruber]|uniref:L-aspartate oxidase n=1 Tax=Litoribacter ruber TaxID=702568 RepID=UPI001BDB0B41|nr:FAD-dependent oxidoreductase [Litoribacter ruber]MBT0812627.1 FAD-binding protein [Litoribacter ruber]
MMVFKDIDKELTTVVLIIGAGAAGIRTAIALKEAGVDCMLVSKREFGDAHTKMAAGGINASLGNLDPEDRWEIHAADTLKEGHFVNDPKAVELVCKNAPDAIRELAEWGCPFNTNEDGEINQRFFGAQSYRRTCFVGDHTGKAILDTLVQKAKDMGIECLDGKYVFELLKNKDRVVGALVLDKKEKQLLRIKSQYTVIAAAGYASIYSRSSSRKNENLGDAMRLALRAGAQLKDMEMVQFHPTGMVKPEKFEGKLVTEAVRGEGGHLLNADKKRFMEDYSPEMMELDARDEVARAIAREIAKGRGTKDKGVYLDISHKEEGFIKKKLPDMYERFESLGINISEKAMEVAPTSHYSMGGLLVDFENGFTGVQGLYAVGEAACGLHGANRLGGNSLIETVVLGKLTGEELSRKIKGEDNGEKISIPELEQSFSPKHYPWQAQPNQVLVKIKNLMWDHAGIIRNEKGLKEGLQQLEAIEEEIVAGSVSVEGLDFENVWANMDLFTVLEVSKLVLKAALERKESRGAHYREDFPDKDENWEANLVWNLDQDGQLKFEKLKVPAISPGVQRALDEGHSLNYHQLE